eukprot:TRINITY_DN2565_c0_g1_i2.p1 TRINITY_DN2565_c0_g1~~TRINITY_DN2565_c0_g1_i2.p1  ORF type:complete len:123 (+),score=30.48 TRINITY_DN2565_c0_g1_i2:97-465(+)
MIRRPPRSTQSRSSAASDVYKRQHTSLSYPSGYDHTPLCQSLTITDRLIHNPRRPHRALHRDACSVQRPVQRHPPRGGAHRGLHAHLDFLPRPEGIVVHQRVRYHLEPVSYTHLTLPTIYSV